MHTWIFKNRHGCKERYTVTDQTRAGAEKQVTAVVGHDVNLELVSVSVKRPKAPKVTA
jgi:hypothetical protein